MKVWFCESTTGKSIGGLDAAIRTLESHLVATGIQVVATREMPSPFPAFDLVHFHGLWHPWHSAVSKALRAHGKPYLISPHGMLEPWAWKHKRWKKLPYFYLRERAHLTGADRLLATSGMERSNLVSSFPQSFVEEIPLGLTGDARPEYDGARARLGWDGTKRTLLFLSRIHEKKGLDLLLRALAGMCIPSFCRLVVVGGGEPGYVQGLQEFATAHRNSLPAIQWEGEVWGEKKWTYLQGADLVCLPSHSENFGLVVLEACQVGTPVLVSTATPWRDLLDTATHLITDPDVESIQHALVRFFRKEPWPPAARTALSEWAWQTFGWKSIVPRYAGLYKSLVSTHTI